MVSRPAPASAALPPMTGEDAPPGLADELRAHLAERWPFAELSCYEGGQPHYPLLVGVE